MLVSKWRAKPIAPPGLAKAKCVSNACVTGRCGEDGQDISAGFHKNELRIWMPDEVAFGIHNEDEVLSANCCLCEKRRQRSKREINSKDTQQAPVRSNYATR